MDDSKLKMGVHYQLSSKIPLMPEFEPRDPIEALRKITYLEPGTPFTPIDYKVKGFNVWYQVSTEFEGGTLQGWVNSVAFGRGDLRRVFPE